MWQRAELKSLAKQKLTGNYWGAFAACLIMMIVSSLLTFIVQAQTTGSVMDGGVPTVNGTWTTLSLIWSIFVSAPLTVGLLYCFIRGREEGYELTNLFAPFKRGYANSVVAMLLMGVFIFLWSLLLIIPGIIKAYAYRMVPFLIAEYPEMGYEQAFAISKQTTIGEKWDMFVLDLSFILWYLLCLITLGLGFFFLAPYLNATYAELYDRLKAKAVSLGVMEGQSVVS